MSIYSYLYTEPSPIFSLGDNLSVEGVLFKLFIVLVILFLFLDLGCLNKESHKISTKSALYQSIFWVVISSLFGLLIYLYHENGAETALTFFSCYLTEKALSVDNIFVILIIFRYFKVDEKHYHRILFWGILGAIIFRGIFIFSGTFLVEEFHWVLYVFGAFLIYSGIKVYFEDHSDDLNPEENPILKICKKYLPIYQGGSQGRFVITKPKFMFTELFLVIILIETTDLLFAMDSIPAVFTITQNDFLIYTSNIFAVLGLRAMFFLLSGFVDKFYLLQKGLSIVLLFIGSKIFIEFFGVVIPAGLSFGIILLTLTASVAFSIIAPRKA